MQSWGLSVVVGPGLQKGSKQGCLETWTLLVRHMFIGPLLCASSRVWARPSLLGAPARKPLSQITPFLPPSCPHTL